MGTSMRNVLVVLGVAAVAMRGVGAFADDRAAFTRILANPGEQAHVLAAAKRASVVLNNPCSSARFELKDTVAIYARPSFDNSGAITGGAWKQVVSEEGCSARRTLNVLVWVKEPRAIAMMPLLPGTTHANPQLQKDGMQYAVMQAGGPEKDCATGYVADTEFLEREAAPQGARSSPWREAWTLASCTKRTRVVMRFIPDSTGTQIVAGPG